MKIRRGIFLTKFELFGTVGNVVKHGLECLIYHLVTICAHRGPIHNTPGEILCENASKAFPPHLAEEI